MKQKNVGQILKEIAQDHSIENIAESQDKTPHVRRSKAKLT